MEHRRRRVDPRLDQLGNPGPHRGQEAKQTKDAARALLTTAVRAVNNSVQANGTITDAQRAGAGLPVHKTSHTPVPAPQTAPMIFKLDNEHLVQRLHFVDSATPGSKARPAGAALCEIRQQIVAAGGAAPTDAATMPMLALDSRPPHRTDFDSGDVGKTAYYALRWVSGKGEQGPWSGISGYPVF